MMEMLNEEGFGFIIKNKIAEKRELIRHILVGRHSLGSSHDN